MPRSNPSKAAFQNKTFIGKNGAQAQASVNLVFLRFSAELMSPQFGLNGKQIVKLKQLTVSLQYSVDDSLDSYFANLTYLVGSIQITI